MSFTYPRFIPFEEELVEKDLELYFISIMTDLIHQRSLLHKKYGFRWEVLDVLIGGQSMLDQNWGLTSYPIQNFQDADVFLKSYGYDLMDPIESAEALGNYHEAIDFVRRFFLQPANPEGILQEIPRKLLELTDLRELVFLSTGLAKTEPELHRKWACALLKVVHTISHLDKDLRTPYFPEIQKQILDRFYKVVHRQGDQLFLGKTLEDPLRVELKSFETKPKKSRDSVLLKLLHKAENVAEDIFDRVGIRFVTQNRLDVFRVVKFLKDNTVIIPANIKPSRSRNTLLDCESIRKALPELLHSAEHGKISESELRNRLEDLSLLKLTKTIQNNNPHSSQTYRSVQFTCRQLIKIRNHAQEQLSEAKRALKKLPHSDEILDSLNRINLQYLSREVRFFYPYEIQILDEKSAHENDVGQSAHSEYKKQQIQAALKRVMGSVLDATPSS